MEFKELGGMIAHEFERVTTLQVGDAFGDQSFQLDGPNF